MTNIFIALTEYLKNEYKGPLQCAGLTDSCKSYIDEDFFIVNQPILDDIHHDDIFCEIIDYYEMILADLSHQLNHLHNKNYSIDYWRLILGNWTLIFIVNTYFQYNFIKQLNIDFNNNWTTYLLDEKSYNIPDSHLSLLKYTKYSDVFMHQLLSQQIRVLYKRNFKTIKREFDLKTTAPVKRKKQLTIKRFFCKIMDNFIQFIMFRSKNPTLHVKLYLSDKSKRLLFFRSKFSFGHVKSFHTINKRSSIDYKMRDKIKNNFNRSNNEIIFCIFELLKLNMPTSILEDFKLYENEAKLKFPQTPKSIITSIGLSSELTRFWMADCKNRKIPIYCYQHGGGYGVRKYDPGEYFETSVSDKFFTWGWNQSVLSKLNKKIKPFYINKNYPLTYSKKPDKLLLVTSAPNNISYLTSNPTKMSDLYYKNQIAFVNSLTAINQKKLHIRLYQKIKFNIDKYYKINLPHIKLEKMNSIRFRDSLSESFLVIIDHNSTTFLETLSNNIPTICFWPTGVRASAVKYFNYLRSAEILHDSPESAATLVNKISSNVLEWWFTPSRQTAINKFCAQFANKSNSIENDILYELKL